MSTKNYKKVSWDEFRASGLFDIMNDFLNIFGWNIEFELGDHARVANLYPARIRPETYNRNTPYETLVRRLANDKWFMETLNKEKP